MALYQKSVLNKYLKGLDQTKVDAAYQKFSAHFHNPSIQLNIRKAKEEQYQGGFLIDLFVKVFGYIKNPEPNFNLTTELKNVKGSKKADGAIMQNGKAIAVIELKGMNTPNLDKVEAQAFGYKSNQPDAVYVITSNFEKIRFYIDNAVDFIEWNLFNLTREQFNEVWLCLAKESVLSGLPKQIKEDSIIEEKTITERLYKDYSTFRSELYNSIAKKNPDIDPLLLFKKTQKLLDRFLFIFFAEDRLLVPPNSISRIIDRWKQLEELDNYKPLYAIFQQYFGYFNNGRKGKKSVDDIFAYNGGLFKSDTLLDKIEIDDYVLFKHTQKLTKYDFVSEVDVNILGHIFEHSLNDIEEIAAQLEGETLDKSKTKRKKDGVFYTPKYITKYIVENTVGKLCEEKKTELGIDDIDFSKTYLTKKKRTTKDGKKTFLSAEGEKILNGLNEYREYLLGLTICDPACGSGAFLNQAFNYLIDEHENIDQYNASLRGDMMTLTDVSKDILEKNLFGVDINNEAVEIAKLSLWLRTAQKGRKLNSLNENIKCGNSLIDDPEVAEGKAFSWEKEFPEVFKNGGFDVVIGNPPYGATVSKPEKLYYKSNYEVTEYNFDTYNFFFELSIKILKNNKYLGFITPNTFLVVENGILLRKFLFEKNKLINLFETFNVFPDAVVEPITSIIKKENANNFDEFTVLLKARNFDSTIQRKFDHEYIRNKNRLIFNYRESESEKNLYTKIQEKSLPLSKIAKVTTGIKPYQTGKGNPKQTRDTVKNKPFTGYEKIEDWNQLIRGTQVNRYSINWNGEYIKYGEWLAEPRKPNIFFKPKIFIRRTDDKILSCYDDKIYIGINSIHCIQAKNNDIDNKTIMCQINSKLVNWYFQHENFHMVGKPLAEVKVVYVERLPIQVKCDSEFKIKADKLLLEFQKLNMSKDKFLRTIYRKFNLKKPSKNLQIWHTLTYTEFIKELKKKKIKLGLAEEAEWEEYFETEKAKAQEIQAVIDKTDREIDQMVYELYGLTKEEIKIVENAST